MKRPCNTGDGPSKVRDSPHNFGGIGIQPVVSSACLSMACMHLLTERLEKTDLYRQWLEGIGVERAPQGIQRFHALQ